MRVRIVFAALASLGLAACARASAATVDSSQDIDCSVITFYFSGLARQTGAEASQQFAVDAVRRWYAVKAQTIAKEKGSDYVLSRAGPVLDAVKRDPMSMRSQLAACTDRAVKDGLH